MHSTDESNFLSTVFPAEIEEIKKRRESAGIPLSGNLRQKRKDAKPTVKNSLFGMALSGGGIRSATFSLGVIQELDRQGLFKTIDYLSTVSGGGYIGSSISSLLQKPLLHDPKNNLKKTPSTENKQTLLFKLPAQGQKGLPSESIIITHLRNSSNYLSPAGLLNALRLPNTLCRGLFLNIFIFMPFIMAAVFFTEWSYEKGPKWSGLTDFIGPLLGLFLVVTLLFPILTKLLPKCIHWKRRNIAELYLTIPLLLIGGILCLSPILSIVTIAIEHDISQAVQWWESTLHAIQLWHVAAFTGLLLALFIALAKVSNRLASFQGKIVVFFVGMIGPLIIFGLYLGLCLWQIDSPYLPFSDVTQLNQSLQCKEPCLMTQHSTLVAELQGRSIELSENAITSCQTQNCLITVEPIDWKHDHRVWVINDAPDIQAECPPLSEVSVFDNAGVKGNCHYLTRYSEDLLRIQGNRLDLFSNQNDWYFVGLFVALLFLNRFLLDMNLTSLHGFYRDRLSKAYIFKVNKRHKIVHRDTLKLSQLREKDSIAPYHLINVAVNLQGSHDPTLRGRGCDFFLLSKLYIGNDRIGFSHTKAIEHFAPQLSLASAMAVSGAAASPNMGTQTNGALVFLLSLLNIRLGYWLPNPKRVNSKKWFHHFGLKGAKPTLLWREALGKLDALGSHVNLSDGGHIENLGIYPLLQRRCQFILAVDAEADPTMSFDGLVRLIRFARIDMGIEINIDLTPLQKDSEGYSQSQWSTATIHYPDGEVGHLLYIKLSITGEESQDTYAYRAKHPAFPHEPTSDQFFEEDQFEAYRLIGQQACQSLLQSVPFQGVSP